jgi:hypothetical protein
LLLTAFGFLPAGLGSVTDNATLLVACLLIYKLDLPQWLYLVAMVVWAFEVGVWRFTLSSEDREFVFLENKLTEIERRIGELRPTASGQG